MAYRCFVHNNQDYCQSLLSDDQRFPQDVRRMRTTDVALHDLGSGKGNRQGAQHVEQEGAGQIAADVGYPFARATRSRKYGRRRICDVA